MDHMLREMVALTSIIVSSFKAEKVKLMTHMFYSCSNLTE